MASSARIDEIKKKFDENPRRYFAPLANEFRKAGDLEQAIHICEEFLPQQAGHMSGHIVYGQALYEAGRLPESRTVFETALGLDPENLIALRHLGDIARGQDDPASARRWYDRVLEADPRNEEIQGLIASLGDAGGGAAAAGTPAPEPVAPDEPARTLVMEPVVARAAEPAPELAPIDLDLDDAGFASPSPAPAPTAAPAPASASDSAFDAISLDGLESTTSADAHPAATVHARAEGLEPAEFEVPDTRHQRAEGLEPSEFEAPTAHAPRAEGLETAEFMTPTTDSTDRSLLDLESSFASEVGGAAPAGIAPAAPLPGLEPAGAVQPTAAEETVLPSLDLDEGLAVPTQGHPDAADAPIADVPLGVAAGPGADNPRMDPPAAMEAMPALAAGSIADALPPAEPAPSLADAPPPEMLELPPAVIAAESALMDADTGYDEEAEQGAAQGQAAQPPFVTETMAALYMKQGFVQQALDVYRQLAAASPHDERLRAQVEAVERADAESKGSGASGPTIREFFFRLAVRRPNERAAQDVPPRDDDFASDGVLEAAEPEPVRLPVPTSTGLEFLYEPEPEPASPESLVAAADQPVAEAEAASEPDADAPSLPDFEPITESPAAAIAPEPVRVPEPAPAAVPRPEPLAAEMPSAAQRASEAQGGPAKSGSIDALFGTRPSSTSEDSAASALAQAFGGTAETPVITGRPARAATAELSLDSVFRDAPPRPPRVSQSFSFDQFFSESATVDAGAASATADGVPAGEPAERSADDVKQFNTWLQGLKPR